MTERKDISKAGVAKMRRWWDYCYQHTQTCENENCDLYWAFVLWSNGTDEQGRYEPTQTRLEDVEDIYKGKFSR